MSRIEPRPYVVEREIVYWGDEVRLVALITRPPGHGLAVGHVRRSFDRDGRTIGWDAYIYTGRPWRSRPRAMERVGERYHTFARAGDVVWGARVLHLDAPLLMSPTRSPPKAAGMRVGRVSRLDDDDVRLIRAWAADGCEQRGISRVFGMSPSAVSKIKRGSMMGHVV